eukprot:s36_g51.t1
MFFTSQEAGAEFASARQPLVPSSATSAASFNVLLSFLTTESTFGPVLLFLVSGLLMGVDFADDETSLGVVVGGAALERPVDFLAGAFTDLAGVAIGAGFETP